MRKYSFILLLFGIVLANWSGAIAETPVNAGVDSSIQTDFSALSNPILQNSVPQIAVNENEIKAGLLYDVVNSKVIWSKNISTSIPIASLTKMMVALLAVEDVRAGKFTWDDRIKWTREIVVGRKKNRRIVRTNVDYSMRDVFKAAMIASNNECAEQLAKYIGNGDLKATIERMNVRANELKMDNTCFRNPTGLPESHRINDNRSSPSDLLVLSLEMLKYEEVIEIASMGYASIENGTRSNVITNHNHLAIEYSGEVDGLKTGYTRRAGFCLVATAAKCDHRLISIVLGCRGPQIRNEVVRDMFNDYYTSISLDRLGLCESPEASANKLVSQNGVKGRYITLNERVKKVHVVKKGENISTVSKRYRCSTAQLRSWNKKGLSKNAVFIGQRLNVYTYQPKSVFVRDALENEGNEDNLLMTQAEKNEMEKVSKQADTEVATIQKAEINPPSKYLYYTVVPGDTLFKISQQYEGITVDDLKSLNKLTNSRFLIPGTKLKIKVQG